MSTWRFIVTGPNMGERTVPAPHDPSGSGQALIKRTGTWVHEEDWPYIKSLKFPCKGTMKNGFVEGCPDAKQMATSPPEPMTPPPAFFETPTAQATKPKRRKRAAREPVKPPFDDHYPDSLSVLDDTP